MESRSPSSHEFDKRVPLMDSANQPLKTHQIVGYGLAGVLIPLVSFGIAQFEESGTGFAEWQSGPNAFLGLFFGSGRLVFFYPLLAWALISLVLLLVSYTRFQQYAVVRIGIYGGCLLALQYAFLLANVLKGLYSPGYVTEIFSAILLTVLACLIAVLVSVVLGLIASKLPPIVPVLVVVLPLAITLIFWLVPYTLGGPMSAFSIIEIFAVPYFFLLMTGPAWTFAVYLLLSVRLLKTQKRLRGPLAEILPPLLLWVFGYAGLLTLAIRNAIVAYGNLPAMAPSSDCYVVTATARGHPGFVRSAPVRDSSGNTLYVNNQLRRLKAFEIALATVCPGAHRSLRKVYDRIGPFLARKIAHPLVADIAYLLLKPAEWFARVTLHIVFRVPSSLTDSLYRSA